MKSSFISLESLLLILLLLAGVYGAITVLNNDNAAAATYNSPMEEVPEVVMTLDN